MKEKIYTADDVLIHQGKPLSWFALFYSVGNPK
jgi:hypothetical protein